MTDYSLYTKIPIVDLTNPENYDVAQIFNNYWWVVTPDDCALLFRGCAPQCNMSKNVCEKIMKQLHPDCRCEQIKLAFVKWED